MSRRSSPPRRGRRGPGRWIHLLGLIPLGLVVLFVLHEREAEMARYELELAAQAEREAVQSQLLSRGDFELAWSTCTEQWSNALSIYQPPQALAWHRGGISAYFEQGVDRSSWRRIDCAADGVQAGPRMGKPYAAPVEVEQLPADQSEPSEDDAWALAIIGLKATPLAGELLGVELLRLPDGGVLRRDWRGLEGAAQSRIQPIGVDADSAHGPFPLLYAQAPFKIAQTPDPLAPLAARNWAAEPIAALDLIAPWLPENSAISELSLRPGGIEVQIVGTIADGPDGEPAPYGELDFDEYGVAERSWWYPRQSPGFGCERGRSLSELRQRLAGLSRPSQPTLTWYSCSPAYSDGVNGTWKLR